MAIHTKSDEQTKSLQQVETGKRKRYTRRKQTLSAQPKACFATTASGSCLCVHTLGRRLHR